jgi:hypothetical protein
MTSAGAIAPAIRALRAFVAAPPAPARCGLCGTAIPAHPTHAHLFDTRRRRVECACGACTLLFGADDRAAYRRLPTRVELLPPSRLTDGDWQALGVPIRLAFFVARAPNAVECVYPSPAGPVASTLGAEEAAQLAAAYPGFRALVPDVEALLLAELAERRAAFRLPIDECYRLVGLARRHFVGGSGGAAWWAAFDAWLAELARRAGGGNHA